MYRYLPFAIVAGTLASLLGGVVWGAITYYSRIMFGFIAVGIGVLTAYGVSLTNQKGLPFQFAGAVCSLAGIVIGKYVTFYNMLSE